MKKGITLVSLIITIVVIIILAGITVFSSLNTVDESQKLKKEAEFNDVCSFVEGVSARANAGLVKIDLSDLTPATESEIDLFPTSSTGYISSYKTIIKNANKDSSRNANYKYYYITGKQIQNADIKGVTVDSEGKPINDYENNFIIPKKVENNYIINFYYGTVVAKVEDGESLIRGQVK